MRDGVTLQIRSNTDNGILSRLELTQKRRLLNAFQDFTLPGGSVLDIRFEAASTNLATCGLTELAECKTFNPVTKHSVHLDTIPKSMETNPYGGFKLPFADGEFDWACSNGVIERMGNAERQFNLVREMTRVVKKGVFVATPNKHHPVNFSGVPRSQMLRAQDLYRLAGLLPGKPKYDVGHKRVFGIKAHFFLIISKLDARQ